MCARKSQKVDFLTTPKAKQKKKEDGQEEDEDHT